MPGTLKTALVSAAAAVAAAVTVFGAATPALAKSATELSGPRVAHPGHAFGLRVSVGDDGGARPVTVRLQVRGAHGRYQWFGPWHRLRVTNHWDASYTFTVTETHRESVTFRAVLGGGYAITNPVTVVVR
jgi:hypothetical protein